MNYAGSDYSAGSSRSAWLGLAIRSRDPVSGKFKIRILWKRVSILFFTLMVTGYLGLMSAFYFYFRYKLSFEEASYWKSLALPLRIEAHRQEMGDYYLKKGKEAFNDHDYAIARSYLSAGLARVPNDGEAIIMLTQFYLHGNPPRYAMAIEKLKTRLEQNIENQNYVMLYFNLLKSQGRIHETIEEAEALTKSTDTFLIRHMLAQYAIQAYLELGNLDEAEALAEEHNFYNQAEGLCILADINWQRGAKQSAIWMLRSGLSRIPDQIPILTQLVKYETELGNYEGARRNIIRLMNARPKKWIPHSDYITLLDMSDLHEKRDEEIRNYLSAYRSENDAMLLLSAVCGSIGLPNITRELYDEAFAAKLDHTAYAIQHIFALINSKRYIDANLFADDYMNDYSDELHSQALTHISALRIIANAGTGDHRMRDFYLNELSEMPNIHPALLLNLSKKLLEVKQGHIVRNLLEDAHKRFPFHQVILTDLITVELESGSSSKIGTYLNNLLKMRRPERNLLEKAYRHLTSDYFIFTEDQDKLIIKIEGMLNEA